MAIRRLEAGPVQLTSPALAEPAKKAQNANTDMADLDDPAELARNLRELAADTRSPQMQVTLLKLAEELEAVASNAFGARQSKGERGSD